MDTSEIFTSKRHGSLTYNLTNCFAFLVFLFCMNNANIETPTPENSFFHPPPFVDIITA